ncbi:hypothetical protein HUT19_14720 [Streptomyces sp. NA02950]|uniref:hypothetical protein n=1 Tax=Streptomyces sp. NA02950 TaxID=2742137 RepID=UPI00158FD578|nr:hypothetical protein [Streptomyces sp. NA02950]QKV92854.1 hypothetical protein HUT19_14720 [Streptomyces sp. NA02950]
MSAQRRLLPWSEPTGKPCYLVSDAEGEGFLSQLADDMEAVQLRMGSELLDHAGALLGDPKVATEELRFLSNRLVEALRDALRVAESRGRRLPVSDGGGSMPASEVDE